MQKITIKNSIATRLLKIVFSSYLIIATFVTVFHMVLEYQYQNKNIRTSLVNIQKAFEQSLALDLWQIEQKSLTSTINGIIEIPEIVGVKIQDTEGTVLAVCGIIQQNNVVKNVTLQVDVQGIKTDLLEIQKNKIHKVKVFEHKFPIFFKNFKKQTLLGFATFYSDSSVIYQRVKFGFLLLVINALLKIIALGVVFLWFANLLIRKPLSSLTKETGKINLDNLETFRIKIKTKGRNEITLLEETFNSMISNLHKSIAEQKHQEIELRTTLNSIADGVITTNLKNQIMQMNPVAEQLSGWKISEAKGKQLNRVLKITNYQTQEREDNPVLEVLKTGHQIFFERHLVLISKNETNYHIAGSGSPIKDTEGNITGVILVFRDNTERYLIRKKMEVNEDRLNKALIATNDGMWDWNLLTNGIYLSKRFYTMAGYEDQEYPNTIEEFRKRIHPDDVTNVMRNIKKNINGETKRFYLEFRILKKNRDWLWVRGKGTIVEKKVNNQPVRFIGTLTDISERKKQEKELYNLRNYLSNIIDSMPSILIGVDRKGYITQWNLEAEKSTGLSAVDTVGQALEKVIPRLSSEIQQIEKSIKTRKENIYSKQTHQKNGKTIYEDITIYPLVANGVEGAVIRIDDVTQKNEIEQQLYQSKKMDAIGQLAGGVAHDFNNMLAGIMGAAQLLQIPERNLNKKSLELVEMILKATKRANDLTTKLLAFGRKGKVTSTSINVHKIIDDTIAIFSRTIDKKIKISVATNAKNSIVIGDDSALQNSLLNLGINASHAMENGGELKIETRNIFLNENYCETSSFDITPNEYIEIEIRDTGEGISPENLQKIFDPFFTTKKQGKGTGLGLASVYGTVQDHHGAITVYSELGTGTSFHLLIPCSQTEIKMEREDDNVLSGNGQILLVDDEELLRLTGKYTLENMGYKVLLAENGLEAVEVFRDNFSQIDLVIMDMIMPEMNGSEAFYKMKEIDSKCKVIISSGFTKDENLGELKKAGLSGFIQKPFRDYELSQLIAEILKTI